MSKRNLLNIKLLGGIELSRDAVDVPLPQSKKTRALLAYLVVTARPHRRERLCSLLWDVTDDPRGALRWSLSKLRPLVDGSDKQRIVADREIVGFNPLEVRVDLFAIRDQIRKGIAQASTEELEKLAGEFDGEFLEGLELPDLHDFHSWCIAERSKPGPTGGSADDLWRGLLLSPRRRLFIHARLCRSIRSTNRLGPGWFGCLL